MLQGKLLLAVLLKERVKNIDILTLSGDFSIDKN